VQVDFFGMDGDRKVTRFLAWNTNETSTRAINSRESSAVLSEDDVLLVLRILGQRPGKIARWKKEQFLIELRGFEERSVVKNLVDVFCWEPLTCVEIADSCKLFLISQVLMHVVYLNARFGRSWRLIFC
jgi:hypothetical protein